MGVRVFETIDQYWIESKKIISISFWYKSNKSHTSSQNLTKNEARKLYRELTKLKNKGII